jgi:hypothetical protein
MEGRLRMRFLAVLLLIFAAGALAAAADCSKADVQAAIDASQDGGTVNVPTGNCTWDSPVQLDKSISVIGDGTVISRNGFFIPAGTDGWRVSGFVFDAGWQDTYLIQLEQSRTGSKDFRIDHNVFMHEPYSTGGTVLFQGYSYGVLDHNEFRDCLNEIISFGGDGAASFERTPVLGGYENGAIFVEDNSFLLTSACSAFFGGDPNGAAENIFDGNSGPRIVFRHNNVSDHKNCRWQYALETHGFESEFSTVGDARAVNSIEVYRNTFTSNYPGAGLFMRIRGLGGGGVVFDNAVDGTGGSFRGIELKNLRSQDADYSGSLSKGNINAAGYTQFCHSRQSDEAGLFCEKCTDDSALCFGQVRNLYVWNNSVGAVTVDSTDHTPQDIVQGAHYFLSTMPGYTPYPYPHPLTDGCIDTSALNSFVLRWLTGKIQIGELIDAIRLWKIGC